MRLGFIKGILCGGLYLNSGNVKNMNNIYSHEKHTFFRLKLNGSSWADEGSALSFGELNFPICGQIGLHERGFPKFLVHVPSGVCQDPRGRGAAV